MACNILVVEDEFFLAAVVEDVVSEMGHHPVGIAADRKAALALANQAEIALVDLNLRDGPTGAEIGRSLADEFGVSVVYLTANPEQLGDGVPGTIGVIQKPIMDDELKQTVEFIVAQRGGRSGRDLTRAPARLRLF